MKKPGKNHPYFNEILEIMRQPATALLRTTKTSSKFQRNINLKLSFTMILDHRRLAADATVDEF